MPFKSKCYPWFIGINYINQEIEKKENPIFKKLSLNEDQISEGQIISEKLGLNTNRVYDSFEILIDSEMKLPLEERMQVVSVLTPNFLHYPMAKKLLENGFNVICEKPLTTSYSEAIELEELQKKNNTAFAVTYTYTGYPMVRHMKHMSAKGELGEIQKVDVQK